MKRFIPSKPGFWAVCPHPIPPAKRSRGWEAVSLVTLTGHWMALWTPGRLTQFNKEKTVLRTGISNTFTEHKTYFSYSTQNETQSLFDYVDMNNMTASLYNWLYTCWSLSSHSCSPDRNTKLAFTLCHNVETPETYNQLGCKQMPLAGLVQGTQAGT